MPVLCDFSVVRQDEASIGVGETDQVERRSLRVSFGTGGRRAEGGALLMFSVAGLTRASADPQVKINDHAIGAVHRYNPGGTPQFPDNSSHWFAQTIAFDAHFLNREGDNTVEFTSVPTRWSSEERTQEDYRVKNVVCFFHQET